VNSLRSVGWLARPCQPLGSSVRRLCIAAVPAQ